MPIFERRGAIHISTEADNFIVIFKDTIQAVTAAIEMQNVLKAYTASLPRNNVDKSKDKYHFRVRLNGIGIHCGKGVVIDKQDKMHGEVYNVAYHIGEDLCEDGNVMISREAMNRVKDAPYFKGNIRYEPTEDDADIFCLKGKLPQAA